MTNHLWSRHHKVYKQHKGEKRKVLEKNEITQLFLPLYQPYSDVRVLFSISKKEIRRSNLSCMLMSTVFIFITKNLIIKF